MKTYDIAQESLLNTPWQPEWEGSPKGRGCRSKYNSFIPLEAETNTALWSNYTPINVNLQNYFVNVLSVMLCGASR